MFSDAKSALIYVWKVTYVHKPSPKTPLLCVPGFSKTFGLTVKLTAHYQSRITKLIDNPASSTVVSPKGSYPL